MLQVIERLAPHVILLCVFCTRANLAVVGENLEVLANLIFNRNFLTTDGHGYTRIFLRELRELTRIFNDRGAEKEDR
jgi:hypothetical protein